MIYVFDQTRGNGRDGGQRLQQHLLYNDFVRWECSQAAYVLTHPQPRAVSAGKVRCTLVAQQNRPQVNRLNEEVRVGAESA